VCQNVTTPVHRVSKNVPPLTCYNLDINSSITIIFGKSVKVSNQNVLYFPTTPNLCFCTTWGSKKPENCVFSLKRCMLFTKKHINTLKYYLATAEPPFTVKTDGMHQTGPRILLSVTHMLYVNQVCHSVGRCALFFVKTKWQSMNSINGISYYIKLGKCRRYQTHHR